MQTQLFIMALKERLKQMVKNTIILRLATLLCIMALLQMPFNVVAENYEDTSIYEVYKGENNLEFTYNDFLEENENAVFSKNEIIITSNNLTSKADEAAGIEKYEDTEAYTLKSGNSYLEYTFNVETAGRYNILLNYYPVKDTGRTIQLGFLIDDVYPYSELENVPFSRIWKDEKNEAEGFEVDELGNEIRPTQVEAPRWNAEWVKSSVGMFKEPFSVYLTVGTHTLRIVRQAESVAIGSIVLKEYVIAQSYDDYLKNNSSKAVIKDSEYIIEAENTYEKNDNRLASTIDNTNAGMTPVDPALNKVNSFGKDYWNTEGQWVSWEVPSGIKPGMYVLRFRAKQNKSVGIATFRTVFINGVIPFKEAESIRFEYNESWYISTAGGDENPYLFYLEPGDILTLKATTGDMAEVINKISQTSNELNEIYQEIIMVTGVTPDEERDYNIQREIPTLLDDLTNVKNKINEIYEMTNSILGATNAKTYFLKEFADFLDTIIINYRTIVDELQNFKSHIDSYVAQSYDINSLQLELDKIYIMSENYEAPNADVGFLKSLWFEIERFICSFTDDYLLEEQDSGKKLTVWTSLGRDQAQAVKSLIEEDFEPESKINVEFVMSATPLVEAILSGLEPDVSLSVTQDVPINLALRGELTDLKPYIDKLDSEYLSQFTESVWIPFKYDGGIYAFPIAQSFNVMFYRSDILAKLGLNVPNTWEEFYDVLRELQKNKFQVGIKEADSANPGISSAASVFNMFMLQYGGKYYNDDLTQVNFESAEGKKAFVQLVELYRDYALDTDFNILTRFRSGEMPIIVGDYSFYAQLAAVGTEIQGRWGMTTVPGTVKEDGSLDRSVSNTVTGSIILKAATERGVADEAFEFVKWWASAQTQIDYSYAMESIQGVAGRPCVANTVAFESIGWTETEKKVLREQRKFSVGIEEVPGNYIILRHFTNALRTSFNDGDDPLRQLNIQTRKINEELIRKRAEFTSFN